MERKKILIIEDESNIREVYAEILSEQYEVIESSDGLDGLHKAMLGEWDLLLLDIMLPKKDGLEVLAEIKRNDILKTKPVILLTNLGRDTIVKEGFTLGASSYLVKSEINPGDVLNSVGKILQDNAS